jgi:protein phosphatase
VTLEIGSESETGRRSENQDRLVHFESDFGSVFVLADGMGGHQSGAVASQLAISTCEEILRSLPVDLSAGEALGQMIQEVNRLIFEEGREQATKHGMGSTLVALLVSQTADGLLAIGAHVGDSRLYFLRQGKLFRLTEDHSLVQRMIRDGMLSETEAQVHPHAGVLTRALGRQREIAVDLTSWMLLQPGDVLMLCSDGLSGYVEDEHIRWTLRQEGTSQQLARRMVDLALERGSEDNVSVLIVKVGADGPKLEWSAAKHSAEAVTYIPSNAGSTITNRKLVEPARILARFFKGLNCSSMGTPSTSVPLMLTRSPTVKLCRNVM